MKQSYFHKNFLPVLFFSLFSIYSSAQAWVGNGGSTLSSVKASNAWLLTGNSIASTKFIGTTNAADFRVRTNSMQRMVVGSNGNIAVNTATLTSAKFHVFSSAEDNHFFASGASPSYVLSADLTRDSTFTSTRPFATIGLATRNVAYSSASVPGDLILVNYNARAIIFVTQERQNILQNGKFDEKMRITGLGNVGINTSAPTARFHVNGSVRFQNLPTNSGTPLVVDANGNVFRSNTSGFASQSSNQETELLKKEVDELKKEISDLKNLFSKIMSKTSDQDDIDAQKPYLYNNIPNPFDYSTTIKYFLPNYAHNAAIVISTLDGKTLKRVDLKSYGTQQIKVQNLSTSGTYIYSLEVDGVIIDSKKMILMH